MLKEKGFDVMCNRFIDITDPDTKIFHGGGTSNWNACSHYVSMPEFQQVTDWLRAKGVHVSVRCMGNWYDAQLQDVIDGEELDETGACKTHDISLEAGIIHALKHYVK